jgi:hypothetical protein
MDEPAEAAKPEMLLLGAIRLLQHPVHELDFMVLCPRFRSIDTVQLT